MGSQAQHVLLSSTTVQRMASSPFLKGAKLYARSHSGDTIYGVNHPGTLEDTKYARLKPGAKSADATWDVPSALNDMHDVAAAGLTAANRMRVIAVYHAGGIGKGTPVVCLRKGNDEDPGAAEFCQTDADTIKFGFAIAAADEIELFVLDAADITTITGGALTAGRDYEIDCYDFMVGTGTNTTNLIPVK